jgi:hypothetical protein
MLENQRVSFFEKMFSLLVYALKTKTYRGQRRFSIVYVSNTKLARHSPGIQIE